MWSRLRTLHIIMILLLVLIGVFILYYVIRFVTILIILAGISPSTATPEEIFHSHILERRSPVPSGVADLQGFEGAIWGYTGPAFIHFEATQEFIDEIIGKGYLKPYTVVPCGKFFGASSKYALSYHKDLSWWRPSEITSPTCYQAQGGQHDDTKYLLVDERGEEVYFYRTPTCGLCPD